MEDTKLANGSRHELQIGRSSAEQDQMDAARSPGKKAGRRLPREKPSLHRPLRKQTGNKSKSSKLLCRYRGAMTWLRVSSSGGLADAESVSLNVMGRRHGRGWRK
jgi:hypothetical protein